MAGGAEVGTPLHRLVLQRLERSIQDFGSCGHDYRTVGRFRYAITGEVDQWLELLHHADLDPEARREVDDKLRELCGGANWHPPLKEVFASWGIFCECT